MKRRMKFIVILSVLIGGIMAYFSLNNPNMATKTEEERRNREYEVSLVNALKNSYEGIEEIVITEPHYTSIPGSWTCTIDIHFDDNKRIKYRINYSIKNQDISDVSLERENRTEDRKYLNSHLGHTNKKIKVYYSDGDEREQ